MLLDNRLTLAPYYECLGPLPLGMGNKPCWTPPAITVNFDPRIVQFVAQSDAERSRVESSLRDLSPGCTVTWPDSTASDSGSVEVSFTGTNCDVSSVNVSEACRDRLNELLEMMEAGSVDVLQEIWPRFVEQWQQLFVEVDASIGVQFDQEKCRVHVVGEREKCSETIAGLGRLQSELVDELQRSQMQISETIKTMSPLQVSLLRTCGLLQTESADELIASVADNVITLEGQPEKVQEQQIKIYKTLASACSEKVRVDEHVFTMLKTEPFYRHVDQLLQQVTGVVWCTDGQEIELYGTDKAKVSCNLKHSLSINLKLIGFKHIHFSVLSLFILMLRA